MTITISSSIDTGLIIVVLGKRRCLKQVVFIFSDLHRLLDGNNSKMLYAMCV